MSFLYDSFPRLIRNYLTGNHSEYIFLKKSYPDQQTIIGTNLYIHIPFCNNMCPYCPYNKIKYDEAFIKPYLEAVLNEIQLYYEMFGKLKISSIYIGGGTPTLLIKELGIILKFIRKKFILKGDICIETNPNDISGDIIKELKNSNVNLVSLGIQSFKQNNLDFIGRNYKASILDERIKALVKENFKSVNIDLIFALPDQTKEDITYDLDKALDLGVNQITTYPLFTFPYTSIGTYLALNQVKMPNLKNRQRLYYHIHNYLFEKGLNRVSVWSFVKGDVPRYSSVTRDNYIGFGAGAGSHLNNGFYLNTFSVPEYIKKCSQKEFPTALFMKFSPEMQNYFWLYWRLYDTYIYKQELYNRFQDDKKVKQLLICFKFFRLIKEDKNYISLNIHGSFWIHLLQNFFSLSYINKIWGVAMREPFPGKISL